MQSCEKLFLRKKNSLTAVKQPTIISCGEWGVDQLWRLFLFSRMKRRQRGLQGSGIFLTDTSKKDRCQHSKAVTGSGGHVGNDGGGGGSGVGGSGMVHISDYGFAHVWEIQQLKPAVGGSESIIDSQDTLSTYVPASCANERAFPGGLVSKDPSSVCSHSSDLVAPTSANKDSLSFCGHDVETFSANKDLLPSCCHDVAANQDLVPVCDYSADTMLPYGSGRGPVDLPKCKGCQEQTVSLITYPCKEYNEAGDTKYT